MEQNNGNPTKYEAALSKYNTNLKESDIQNKVNTWIEKKVAENNTLEIKKFLFNCIDLTTLNTTDSNESVMKFTEKVNRFGNQFPDLPNVAAICVYPNFAQVVKDTLETEEVRIA